MSAEHPTAASNSSQATPYSPPDDPGLHLEQQGCSASISVRVIAVIDFLLGTAVAGMILDSPWISILISFFVFSLTTVTAWGLFRHRIWGWWCGIILHSTALTCGTIGYAICMFYLISEFGRPPGHMALISSEGAAVLLTVIYLPAALMASIPLLVLGTRRCRRSFGRPESRH